VLYESEVTFRPKNFPYNADVIAVWANEIGPLQISNRYYPVCHEVFVQDDNQKDKGLSFLCGLRVHSLAVFA
jgi:hypothetical protein